MQFVLIYDNLANAMRCIFMYFQDVSTIASLK